MMTIIDYVDALFEQAADRRQAVRMNPVTGSSWLPGSDSTKTQKEKACRALAARAAFAVDGPYDCQPLPLTYQEREFLKAAFGLGYIVALYARSLASLDFTVNAHPSFSDYASGLLALPYIGSKILKSDPTLRQRFPPIPLIGIDGAGYFAAPRRAKGRTLGRR